MNKWDTIQADVADMYIGKVENENWEKAYLEDKDLFDQDDLPYLDGDLTLDWED